MGLFSRKKIISVSSVTVNMAGDEQINYLRKTINSAVTGGSDIASTLNQAYLKGMGIQIKQAYRYGRDYYALGLPDGSIFFGTPNNEEIIAILTAIEGKEVVLTMANYGAPDLSYWIEEYLTDTYHWDTDHGGIGNPPSGVLSTAAINYTIDNNGLVTITMTNPGDTAPTFTEDVSFPVDYDSQYYHVIYRVKTPGTPTVTSVTRDTETGDEEGTVTNSTTDNNFGEFTITDTTVVTTIDTVNNKTTIETTVVVSTLSSKKYWMYAAGTGTYPQLDSILTEVVRDSAYYPVVPLRVNNKDLTDPANVSADQFSTSKKLMRKLNLNFVDLGERINENPDVKEIDHAFFVMGISLNSQYESSIDYLHEFFKYLAQVSPSDKEAYVTWYNENVDEEGNINELTPKPPVNTLYLRQKPYDISIAYQYSDMVVKSGSIGPVGTVTRTSGPASAINVVNQFDVSTELTADVTVITFRKQISENQYEEVETCGLQHVNNVYKGHSVDISGEKSLNNPDTEGFLIPLCVNVTDAQQLVARTQMTFDCLHLVVNSYEVTKAKWYQTGIFKVVTIVVAVVIAVYSGGTLAAGVQAAAAAAAAAGTSVALAVAIYIVTQVAIGVAISYGVSIASRYINANILLIAGVALMAYGMYSQYTTYGSSSTEGLPYAHEAMSLSGAVLKGTNQGLQKQIQDAVSEMRRNEETYERQMKEVKDAMDLLGNTNPNVDIDALINAAFFNLFESPNDFLTRTLNTNPGIDSIAVISGYVDSTLSLPNDLSMRRV